MVNTDQIKRALVEEFNSYGADMLERLGLKPPISERQLAEAWYALLTGNEFDEMDFNNIMVNMLVHNAWHISSKAISAVAGGGPFIDINQAALYLSIHAFSTRISDDN